MPFEITTDTLWALGSVIMIDIVLAGDNAIAVGMAAAGLPPAQRRRAIAVGIFAATALRVMFALVATQLLQILGLMLAGGILLLWVCWKLWSDLSAKRRAAAEEGEHVIEGDDTPVVEGKTLRQAIMQIVAADISMSLDNVLAVAGAAIDHPWVMAFGLLLSVALMAVAATFVAALLQKHRWIAYVGLAIITYVAVTMIYDGGNQVVDEVAKAGLI